MEIRELADADWLQVWPIVRDVIQARDTFTRGTGVGTALCRYALNWAREHRYAGMQFNAVVETNRSAVEIYKRLGFAVIGIVPCAFEHPVQGRGVLQRAAYHPRMQCLQVQCADNRQPHDPAVHYTPGHRSRAEEAIICAGGLIRTCIRVGRVGHRLPCVGPLLRLRGAGRRRSPSSTRVRLICCWHPAFVTAWDGRTTGRPVPASSSPGWACSTGSSTKTETIVRIRGEDAEFYFLNTAKGPDALRIELSEPLRAISNARAAQAGDAEEPPDLAPGSISDQLSKLASLLQQGLITRDEFDHLKAKLIAES